MRIVRIQVSAREFYRGASGRSDMRSITIEADLESGDEPGTAIATATRRADTALQVWISKHRQPEPEPEEFKPFVPPASYMQSPLDDRAPDQDAEKQDTMPF